MLSLPLNNQPVEKVDYREDGSLEVVNIFDTIQGEGPYAGFPAVFVRLAGCTLQCPNCDTDYTTGRRRLFVQEVLTEINKATSWIDVDHSEYPGRLHRPLIVLTGGEPFRQNITPLTNQLLSAGFLVQVETNGALHDPRFNYNLATVVCSPKTTVHPAMWKKITALKYVVRAGEVNEADGLPTRVLGLPLPPPRPNKNYFHGYVYIQPEDSRDAERNQANIQAAVQSCRKFGYILSLQQHKIIGLE